MSSRVAWNKGRGAKEYVNEVQVWKCCGSNKKPLDSCSIEHKNDYPKRLESARKYAAKLRIEALLHYGGKCACCGFSNLTITLFGQSFLQIDHIHGKGSKHIRSLVSGFYDWLKRNRYPKGFRVLCRGCNHSMPSGARKCLLHRKTKPLLGTGASSIAEDK